MIAGTFVEYEALFSKSARRHTLIITVLGGVSQSLRHQVKVHCYSLICCQMTGRPEYKRRSNNVGLMLATVYDIGSTNSQQIRDINSMLFQCWASVEDDGPTLKQHRVNFPC